MSERSAAIADSVGGLELADVADWLAAVDLASLSDAELHAETIGLHIALQRVAAQVARFTNRWEASAVWSGDGSKSAAARLERETGQSPQRARRNLSIGRQLNDMPLVNEAWTAGEITEDSVSLLSQARSCGRGLLFANGERELVNMCTSMRYTEARRAVHYWQERANAELGNDGDPPVDTFVSLEPTLGGAVSINGLLDPIGGAEVQEALRRIEHELHLEDQKSNSKRTHQQCSADALVEMARRAMATPEGSRKPQPLVVILAGDASFEHVLELSNGEVIGARDVASKLDQSLVQSFIYDGSTPIAATNQRTFRGRMRMAILARDRRCQHPSGCDAAMVDCDVDHTNPVSNGGRSSADNAGARCRTHNRRKDFVDDQVAGQVAAARERREMESLTRARLAEGVARLRR